MPAGNQGSGLILLLFSLLGLRACLGTPFQKRKGLSCWQPAEEGPSQPTDKGAALCLMGSMGGLNQTTTMLMRNLLPSLEEDGLAADIFIYGPPPNRVQWKRLGKLLESGQVVGMRFANEDPPVESLDKWYDQALNAARRVGGNWMTKEIVEQGKPKMSAAAFMLNAQEHCLNLVKEREEWRDHRYRHIVYSRPDMKWLFPHPPLSWLGNDFAWIPGDFTMAEDPGGMYDKHFVLPRGAADHVLGGLELLHSGCAVLSLIATLSREELAGNQTFPEHWFKTRLLTAAGTGKGDRLRVARFPAIAYTSCDAGALVTNAANADFLPGGSGYGSSLCSEDDDLRNTREHHSAMIFLDCLRKSGGAWTDQAVAHCFCPHFWNAPEAELEEVFGFPDVFEICKRAQAAERMTDARTADRAGKDFVEDLPSNASTLEAVWATPLRGCHHPQCAPEENF